VPAAALSTPIWVVNCLTVDDGKLGRITESLRFTSFLWNSQRQERHYQPREPRS
jgi:hypothetical protein